MPSDIFIKTSSGWTAGKAKKIFIKTASATWSAAKSVFLFFDAGWTKVWPLSGVYPTRNPFVSTTSSSTELSSSTVLRVGTTYRGNRGTWNPNGYTISSYQYKWVAYEYEDPGDLTTNYDPSMATLSGTTNDFLINGTNYDRSWITFFVTAKASGGTAYDGSAESFRYYVVRQKPELASGGSPSLSFSNLQVGSIISYSSSWKTGDAYKIETDRSTIKWYRSEINGLTESQLKSLTPIQSGGYSYEIVSEDNENYIYAMEEVFNSGTDLESLVNGVTAVTQTVSGASSLSASGFARSNSTVTPSQPGTLSFSSSNNQVTTSWTNGSPVTSVNFAASGAGVNTNYTDSSAPFMTSDLSAYSSSGTYTATVTNFNNSLQVTASWNQSGAQSYKVNYSSSVFGADEYGPINNSGSSVSQVIPWSSNMGSFTFQSVTLYTGLNGTGTSNTFFAGLSAITPSQTSSSRTTSTSLTFTPPLSASGFARTGTPTPSQPGTLSFSSTNNQVTTSWSNGSPITSVNFTASGAGVSTNYTDSSSPFMTSDLSAYSSSGTYTATVTNFNNNLSATVSWNQSGAQSYKVNYSSSVFGADEYGPINNSGSSVSQVIPWSSNMGSFTFQSVTLYTGLNGTGVSNTFFATFSAITPSQTSSSRTASTSLTFTPLNLITNPAYGAATSTSGGWTAFINTQPNPTGGTYSVVSQTSGSASVNPSTGALTASGLTSGQSSTVTVRYSRSGYNSVDITASGTGAILLSASGFARTGTPTPSQPGTLSFSSTNNQVTTSWSNGSPITSVNFTASGAGVSTNYTDSSSPFMTSDLSAYSSSGTYTATVTNFNNNLSATVSWNQSGAQSYKVNYSSSVFGADEYGPINNSGSSVSQVIPWSSNMGSFTFQSVTLYTGLNGTGVSNTFFATFSAITPSQTSSSRTASTSLTFTPPPVSKLSSPTGLSATTNRTDGINISWNAVSGAAYYGVWYRGGAPVYDSAPDFGGPSGLGGWNGSGTSFLDTSIGSGVTRSYDVQAFKTGNPAGTKSDWAGPVTGTRANVVAPPVQTAPAITGGPSISWASGNNFTLSATASNATNLEFEVQFANNSGGPALYTQTFFFGASTGGGTTGNQQYSWARTRVKANNSSTGLSSSFSGYTGWA